jgi:hypothetical protein
MERIRRTDPQQPMVLARYILKAQLEFSGKGLGPQATDRFWPRECKNAFASPAMISKAKIALYQG